MGRDGFGHVVELRAITSVVLVVLTTIWKEDRSKGRSKCSDDRDH